MEALTEPTPSIVLSLHYGSSRPEVRAKVGTTLDGDRSFAQVEFVGSRFVVYADSPSNLALALVDAARQLVRQTDPDDLDPAVFDAFHGGHDDALRVLNPTWATA